MEELGKKYNAEYVPGKYHMMLAKQGSRGIIMEPEGILGNYLVTEHVWQPFLSLHHSFLSPFLFLLPPLSLGEVLI